MQAMGTIRTLFMLFVATTLLVTVGGTFSGCDAGSDDGATAADKPAADPDDDVDPGKADGISHYLTTFIGHLDGGLDNGFVESSISFPDWFHGYAIKTEAGQVIDLSITASADSIVRLYGPAVRWRNGRPYFRDAVVRGETDKTDAGHVARFEHLSEEGGTYMVVVGPLYVWDATYTIETRCAAGCAPEGSCASSDECGAGEFCGHNGVNCVMAPCDVSFDICQPKLGEGAGCVSDEACGAGLGCIDHQCTKTQAACSADADCDTDAWCACADGSCDTKVCKPWASEGDSCGGFTLPHYYERCEPGFSCVASPFIADIPGKCGAAVTVADIVANPSKYEGRYVGIRGHLQAGIPMCTKMACGPDNPCCNSCGGSLKLYDEANQFMSVQGLEVKGDDGEHYGCGGNECTWKDNCTAEEGVYWMSGWVETGNYGIPTLSLREKRHGF